MPFLLLLGVIKQTKYLVTIWALKNKLGQGVKMEEENKNVGADATTENTGADKATETKTDYAEMMRTNKDFQSFVDSQKSQAIKTAVANAKAQWEEDSKTKMAEAEKLAKMDKEEKAKYKEEQYEKKIAEYEARENARALKDEAINIVSKKEIPVGYLTLFKFENMNAEEVKSAIETIESLRNKDRETYLNDALKQKTPTQKQTTGVEEEDPYLKGFDSV